MDMLTLALLGLILLNVILTKLSVLELKQELKRLRELNRAWYNLLSNQLDHMPYSKSEVYDFSSLDIE